MPTTVLDGIETHYDVLGEGHTTLLMLSPGGFDAKADNWRTLGRYHHLALLDRLPARYRVVVFDRRESGRSGGRVERIAWRDYADQALGLLDHLGVDRAHLMGGCVGCSIAAVFAVAHPHRTASLVLFSPAGGARYRLTQHERVAIHLAYVAEHGLPAVVELARSDDAGFSKDPRVGPWATVIRRDASFAARYAEQDLQRYRWLLAGLVRVMFDRDTVPGPEPEDLLGLDLPALIIPGQDHSHAPSAARYLEECLHESEYWDVPVHEQTADAVERRIAAFVDRIEGAAPG